MQKRRKSQSKVKSKAPKKGRKIQKKHLKKVRGGAKMRGLTPSTDTFFGE